MRLRKAHRIIGIALLIPFFAWALTGLVFFIKPGYAGAYEMLAPKTYALGDQTPVKASADWQELRYIRTVLGNHLLVRTTAGWTNLDPVTLQPRTAPTGDEVRTLLKDAFSSNPQRFGEIVSVNGYTATTNTGVEVTLDWNRMSLQQKGKDTDRIDLLYRIHYLQWTGQKSVDRVVGLIGIALVLILTTLGALLALKRG
jgi:PepSY-associated TM region